MVANPNIKHQIDLFLYSRMCVNLAIMKQSVDLYELYSVDCKTVGCWQYPDTAE